MPKACTTCHENKDRSQFYTNNRNKDGLFYECKACCAKRLTRRRAATGQFYREYDIKRNATEARKQFLARAQAEYRARNKRKVASRLITAYAIRTGKLVRQPCERCGSNRAQAHHENYDHPLEVMWLCSKDHKLRHRELKQLGIKP